jgi:hypothetical protein
MKITKRQLQSIILENLGVITEHVDLLKKILSSKGRKVEDENFVIGRHYVQGKVDTPFTGTYFEIPTEIIATVGSESDPKFVPNVNIIMGHIYRGIMCGMAEQYGLSVNSIKETQKLNDRQYKAPVRPVVCTSPSYADDFDGDIMFRDTYLMFLNFKKEVDSIKENHPEAYNRIFKSDEALGGLGDEVISGVAKTPVANRTLSGIYLETKEQQ